MFQKKALLKFIEKKCVLDTTLTPVYVQHCNLITLTSVICLETLPLSFRIQDFGKGISNLYPQYFWKT